jgi:stage II sporulation protein D
VRRNLFLTAAGAFTVFPRAARATGGLDVEAPESTARMRVLLASGSFAPPQPIDAWHFAWNGRSYRGTPTTATLADGRVGLVDELPLDTYLYGVLGKEISASWASGAQQAQAILSRTYALAKLRPEKSYDVVASESDQHYGGMDGESVECRAAIDATAGRIVTFGGLPAHVAYSACCGGRTADAGDIWRTSYPYLAGVADPNCAGAPNFAWTVDVTCADAVRAFGAQMRGFGALRDVRVDAVAPGERPTAVAFVGATGTFQASAADVRNALGTSVVRSTFVRSAAFDARAQTVTFAGTGRGHGVGVCQWGARAMGEAGASASEILSFYMPGTSLGRA